MVEYVHKAAKKKLTKSQKKQGASIREEIEWVSKAKHWPFSEGEEGEKYRQYCLRMLQLQLKEIYGENV